MSDHRAEGAIAGLRAPRPVGVDAIFSSPPGQSRVRRATDLVVLVPTLLVLGLLIAAQPPGDIERSFSSFLASFPGWLDPIWRFVYNLVACWAIVLLVAAVISRRRAVVVEAFGSLGLALLIALAASGLAAGSLPDVGRAVAGGAGATQFPAFRLAASIVVILSVGAHLVRPVRMLGRWIVAAGLLAALFVAPSLPSGIVAALCIAAAAAAAARLALGTSAGLPGLGAVEDALEELGLQTHGLVQSERQRDAALVVHGRDPDGNALSIKMYGRDAHADQFLTKCWRSVIYRDGGPGPGVSRVQAAEHEAVLTVLAGGAGVPVRHLVAVGTTTRGDALLVLAGEARPLRDLGVGAQPQAPDAWRSLQMLADGNIAHRQISPATVADVDGLVGLVDFSAAVVSPSEDQRRSDRAALLATTATVIGVEPAIAVAVGALGSEGVAELLPYLQPAAFCDPLRRALKRADVKADDLLERTAAAVGAEPPALQPLRRVSWKSIVQAGLLLFATWAIASAATNVDVGALRQSFAEAIWTWIVVGFFVAQVTRITLAISTLGSLAAKLRFGPVYLKQLSESYLALALPSSLARMAISIRFFQKQGVPPASAVSSGAIESFAGNVVQVVLLILLLVFTESTIAFDLVGPSTSGMRRLLVLVLVVVTASIAAFAFIPRLRHAITGRVAHWWPDVRHTLATLRTPNKIGLVIAGNLAAEILFAGALGLFAYGFGSSIPLTELLVINISISLLASFVPVPGGIGVVEWGLAVGLTAAGMSDTDAFATVFCYRLSTFYLPPIWGFFAMRRLQTNRYL